MKAVTRPLEHDIDLNGVARGDGFLFVRDGVGLAGRGVATRVARQDVGTLLGSIERDDTVGHAGCGAIAFGALPFLPGAPSELVVPSVVVGKAADGTRWITHIDSTAGDHSLVPTRQPVPFAGSFTLRPGFDADRFMDAVVRGRTAVREGRLDKVVLARDVVVEADRPLDVYAILLRLKASFGSSYRYSVDGFVGASPELLVARQGDMVRSHPLAGTAPRTGDPGTDAQLAAALIASTKDQIEHRVVIEVVNDTLLPWCSYLDWEAEPSIITVANVQHLGTSVEGRLSSPPPSVLELVGALQPTPALGGHPRAIALDLISQLEDFERGRYGGAVGWVDADGNGTWAVGIRCAEIDGPRARLFAGVGVVAESDPHLELAETQAKFQAMLSAIVRP
jgi:isochorismate synthase